MEERDKLFYEDAKEAVNDPDKKPSFKRKYFIAIGVLIALLLAISIFPFSSVEINPPPDMRVINSFRIPTAQLSNLRSLSSDNYNNIEEALDNIDPSRYRIISVKLVSEACSSSSKLCYAEALFYYVQNRIRYISDPSKSEYVQLPQETLTNRAGDCEDKSVLLASLLESIGVDADVGITNNHAFVRAKLEDASFLIKRDNYVYLDPSSNKDFGEISFKDEEVIRFHEIY